MKNRITTRVCSALLAVAVAAAPVSANAAALGQPLRQTEVTVAEGTQLASGVYWSSSDWQRENYIEYTPNQLVTPMVVYGSQLYGRGTLDYMTTYLQNQGKTVVAGVNADYFEFASGISIGPVITDGIIRGVGQTYTVGFRDDGTAIIGQPSITPKIEGYGLSYTININKEVDKVSGLNLFTRDYAATTKASIPTYSFILTPSENEIKIGGTITLTVDEIVESDSALDIPEGKMVMSIAQETEYISTYEDIIKQVPVGAQLTLSVTAQDGWQDVRYAVGGGDLLLANGNIQTTDTSSRASRTAVGVKSDGTVVLYTMDGRQSGYSQGATLAELAERMLELGCTDALNLDGGGSTVIGSRYPGESGVTVVNQPSEGSQRQCANYIFLVSNYAPAGSIDRLAPYPYDVVMLAGATQSFTTKTMDLYYNASAPTDNLTYICDDLGAMVSHGVYMAGSRAGIGTVTVTSGAASGTAKVTIVESPTELYLVDEDTNTWVTGKTVNVSTGGVLNLKTSAKYNKLDFVYDDSCFTWTAESDIGTVDANGTFTATTEPGSHSGTVTATVGSMSASVNITVSVSAQEGYAVEGFENSSGGALGGAGIAVDYETDKARARYGNQSLSLTYDTAQYEGQVSASANIPLDGSPTTLSIWVYGDNSGAVLSVGSQGDAGVSQMTVTTIDFTGWKYVYASFPEGINAITGFSLSVDQAVSGQIWIDQLIASNGPFSDVTGPAISFSTDEQYLYAAITDDTRGQITSGHIAVYLDGSEIAFTYQAGVVTVALPEPDGLSHKITVKASDTSGNLSSKSYEIAVQDLVNPFADMDRHWSRDNTLYLYRTGIVSGIESKGALYYEPDSNMNRAQFAVIMAKFLGVDTSQFRDVSLPFQDISQIPAWALDSVKAMYSLGIVKGSGSGSSLKYNPTSPITRAEAMTMIGRTQPKGYTEASLTQFSDSGAVQSWAEDYIKALVNRGVISGINGKIEPNSYVTRSQVAKMLYTLI